MALLQRIGAKLSRETRYLRRDMNHLAGFNESFYREARGNRILIYHGICKKDNTRFNPIFLKWKTLDEHFRFYKEYFNTISLDDFYRGNFRPDKFNVCLTFDDGFANNYKYVLPLLKQYQLPATFFVTSIREAGYDILWNDFLGIFGKYGPDRIDFKNGTYYKGFYNKYISRETGESLTELIRSDGFESKAEMMRLLYPLLPFKENRDDEDYWLQMTEEQIRELSLSPFVTIGSHSHYHNDLSRIPIADASKEMIDAKIYLENIIDRPVNSLAFPYGTYTPEVVASAQDAGYEQLLCMDFHFEENHNDAKMRERLTVNPFISTVNQMHAIITRNYE